MAHRKHFLRSKIFDLKIEKTGVRDVATGRAAAKTQQTEKYVFADFEIALNYIVNLPRCRSAGAIV